MTPAVSVVMAAKNYARYLPMAVRSVQAQSFPNWELLIVDDGSTDDTPEAVKPFLKDARIKYHASDRLGQSRAKNLGVRLSRAPFIAFLDADDAWRPEKLTRQMFAMTDDPDIGVVTTNRDMIDENDLHEPQMLNVGDRSLTLAARDEKTTHEIFIRNPICFSSVMVRRDVFDRVGGFDPDLDLSIDYDLWLRVASHFRIVQIAEPLTLYRTGHGNLSKRQSDRIATAFTIMRRADRRGLPVEAKAVAEGYASTHRSLGWLYRGREIRLSSQSYARALCWPHQRLLSIKGLLGGSWRGGGELAAENRPENA